MENEMKNNPQRRQAVQHILGLGAVGLLPLAGCAVAPATPVKENGGQFITHENFIAKQAAVRRIVVWLPPGYDRDAVNNTRYPVLYMHDGQNLFDPATSTNGQPWAVDKKVIALMRANRIRPPIIVGIDNTSLRRREYAPVAAVATMSPAAIEAGNYAKEPLLSDGYLHFMVSDLKPFIDRRYRTLTDAPNTATMGASMGGLISLYALAKYPETFGAAGCLSTHWPFTTKPELVRPPVPAVGLEIANSFITWVEQNLPKAGKHKLYFDHGTINLDALYSAYQQRVDAIVKAKGYVSNKDWITVVEAGADHNETAWRGRVDVPLQLFFKT